MNLTEIPRKRLIEWWSLLNAHRTPRDLSVGEDLSKVFEMLDKALTDQEKLDFWNGGFKCGLNWRRYK